MVIIRDRITAPFWAISALVLLISGAGHSADKARYVPDVGTELVYKTVGEAPGNESVCPEGRVTSLRVSSSDGVTATSKWRISDFLVKDCICKGDENCENQLHQFNADNGFYVIPMPRAIADKESPALHITYKYFLPVDTLGPIIRISTKDGKIAPEEYGGGTVSTKSECDWSEFMDFFPIGRTARIRLMCKQSTDAATATPPHQEKELTWTISYEGESSISLSSGKWDVKQIRMKRETSPLSTDEEILFSESLGAPVKRVLATRYNGQAVSQTTTELLKHSE
jgi:hypothetical protein